MKLARGDARNRNASAISSGVARRRNGMALVTASTAPVLSLSVRAWAVSVATGPADTALTRTSGADSSAIERVKALVLEKVKAANPEVAALLEKDDEFRRL